jgi:hypothetical protein
MGHSHPFSYSYLGCSAIPRRAQHWREDNVLRSCDEIGMICSNIKWRFPEIGVPPIIQNQTTLVLKPMVLGYPILGNLQMGLKLEGIRWLIIIYSSLLRD